MYEPEYLKVSEIARRASVSPRIIKKHLDEIPYYRITPRSAILIRWADFEAWMDKRRQDARDDPDVRAILEKIAAVCC